MPDDLRICFFAERQVGIGSQAGTLKPLLCDQPGQRATWVDVTYADERGLLEQLPVPRGLRGPLRGYLQTRAGLQQGPHDALFFLTHNPAVFQPGALARTPTVLWTDVTPDQLDRQARDYEHKLGPGPLQRLKRARVLRTFQLARFCVGWSEWARRSFVEDYGIAPERTAVIEPGVDLSNWKAPPARAAAEGRALKVLFVGGDLKRKGGDLLIDVFRNSLRGRCELDIVTRDPLEPEPGLRVHRGLTPGSEPLLRLYREADLFALPTRADCHSIASLEAMAMGLPVVSTRVGGIPEVIVEGVTGRLIAPGDGAALEEALRSLLDDPLRAREMGAHGRARVESRFDARKSASRICALLAAAARGEAAPAGGGGA